MRSHQMRKCCTSVQLKIFSRAGLPFPGSCENGSRQNGVHNVSGLVECEPKRGDRQRLEIVLQGPQIGRIFFCGQEAARTELLAQGEQALQVSSVIGVMIAELDFRGRRDSGGSYLRRKTAAVARCHRTQSARRAQRV